MKKILLFVTLCFFCPGVSVAGSAPDSTGQVLSLNVLPRSAAMGDSFVAVGDGDPGSMRWNPAGLAEGDGGGAFFSRSTIMDGVTHNLMAVKYSRGGNAFGLSGEILRYGQLESRDAFGNADAGENSPSDIVTTFSWSRKFQRAVLGLNLKYFRLQVDDSTGGWAADIGGQVKAGKLSLGVLLKSLGPGVKFSEEAESLPLTAVAGAALRATGSSLFTASFSIPKGGYPYGGAGGEFQVGKGVFLRFGYSSRQSATGGLAGVSAGAGVAWKKIRVDFSMISMGVLGISNSFGLVYGW